MARFVDNARWRSSLRCPTSAITLLASLALVSCGDEETEPANAVCTPDVVTADCPPTAEPDAAVIVEKGTGSAYRLRGTIIGPSGPFDGEVLVIGDSIACVAKNCADEAQGTESWLIDTQGVILPGLIDTHNHILFDIFNEDDWVPSLPLSCASNSDCTAGSDYCNGDKCRCVDGVSSPRTTLPTNSTRRWLISGSPWSRPYRPSTPLCHSTRQSAVAAR